MAGDIIAPGVCLPRWSLAVSLRDRAPPDGSCEPCRGALLTPETHMRRSISGGRAPATLLLALAAGAGCAPRAAPAPAARPAPSISPISTSPTITPEELQRDLYVFASDSFRGRETGTPDAVRAARFIADRLAALGVEPAGDS